MERIGVDFVAGLQPNEIVECVKYAEELGYESAWMAEGHGGDQFSILTACALQTRSILLGSGISVVFVRSAPTVAMAAACVDQFSNGRFILGLGSGHREMVEGEHGLRYHRPIQHIREYVDIVRGLLQAGEIRYSGELTKIDGFDLWFKPLRGRVPIYLGALNPRMLEVCGEIAEGVMLGHATIEKVREAVEHIAVGARRAGRRPEDVDVSALWGCHVAPDMNSARESYRDYLALYPIRLARYRRVMAEAGFHKEVEAISRAHEEGRHAEGAEPGPRRPDRPHRAGGYSGPCCAEDTGIPGCWRESTDNCAVGGRPAGLGGDQDGNAGVHLRLNPSSGP